jgi:hypothetical protein
VKIRRLLLAACAACALTLACVTGQLRGAAAVSGGGGPATAIIDTCEALPPASALDLPPQAPRAGQRPLGDSQFPPSRMVSADVFRPPQA